MTADGSVTLPGTPNPDAPNPQLPIVQKMRIRYAKRGRLRFTSHRDFGRAFERAIRRSRVPIAYSSGFTPHPKVSYAGATPTGTASEAEYLEIGLTQTWDPQRVHSALNESLPPGLDVLEVVVATGPSLSDVLQASHWQIRVEEVETDEVQRVVERFLNSDEVIVERMTKRGLRSFDCRTVVVSLQVKTDATQQRCAILDAVVRHDTPSVRPDDILSGLRDSCGLRIERTPVVVRLAQGPLDAKTGTVGDPFALDRDAP